MFGVWVLLLPGGTNPIGHEPKFSLTLRALPSSDWLLTRDFFEVVLFGFEVEGI